MDGTREPAQLERRRLKSVPRRALFAMVGGLLAFGAPAGLLIVRSVWLGVAPTPAHVLAWISADPLTYAYISASSWVAFVALGYWLGHREDLLRLRSYSDSLTGLANRRLFYMRLHEEFARARRYNTLLALLLIDVDHLKRINDKHGHASGDAALSLVGDGPR